MLEVIIQEIEEMECPVPEATGYLAAVHGFEEAKACALEIIRSHMRGNEALPEPYMPQKSVGDNYKQQIMERFMKVE